MKAQFRRRLARWENIVYGCAIFTGVFVYSFLMHKRHSREAERRQKDREIH